MCPVPHMYYLAFNGSVSALSVQLDSEGCDVPDKPLSWSIVQDAVAGLQKHWPEHQAAVKLLKGQIHSALLLLLCCHINNKHQHHNFIVTCTLVRLQGLPKYVESTKSNACMQCTRNVSKSQQDSSRCFAEPSRACWHDVVRP